MMEEGEAVQRLNSQAEKGSGTTQQRIGISQQGSCGTEHICSDWKTNLFFEAQRKHLPFQLLLDLVARCVTLFDELLQSGLTVCIKQGGWREDTKKTPEHGITYAAETVAVGDSTSMPTDAREHEGAVRQPSLALPQRRNFVH